MSLTNRVRVLERKIEPAPFDYWEEQMIEIRRERAEFLNHIPISHRDKMAAAFEQQSEKFSQWVGAPFAKWAGPMPPDYTFPLALVNFLLNPPRNFWMGSHCGTCGLTVPLYLTWSNDPYPPSDLQVFPICPACGGKTSHAANYKATA